MKIKITKFFFFAKTLFLIGYLVTMYYILTYYLNDFYCEKCKLFSQYLIKCWGKDYSSKINDQFNEKS